MWCFYCLHHWTIQHSQENTDINGGEAFQLLEPYVADQPPGYSWSGPPVVGFFNREKRYAESCRGVGVSLKTENGEEGGGFYSPSLHREMGNVGNVALACSFSQVCSDWMPETY